MVWDGDPCSEQMGQWVDRWLVSLRQQGATQQDCERMARRLARAVRHTSKPDVTLENFIAFVEQQDVT